MGAWGPAIFSDDTACDVRSEYRELLEDQISDEEATRRVIEAYQHLDDDERHVLWLALAAAQSQLGRLDDGVKRRALEIIDEGHGLQLWEEAGANELAKRKSALAKLRKNLVGPQPARKTVRRPWRHVTDLEPGDVLAFTTNGQVDLLRVLRVDDERVGAAPIVEWLDWSGADVPSARRLRRLKPRARASDLGGPARPEVFRVARHRRKDLDWAGSGFTVVSRLPPRTSDAQAQAWSYTNWTGLAKILEQRLRT